MKYILTKKHFQLLNESLSSAKKKFGDKMGPLVDELAKLDPSPTKKYLEKMCAWMLSQDSKDIISNNINRYDYLFNKNLLKKEDRDFNKFDTLHKLMMMLKKYQNAISGTEIRKNIKNKQAKHIFENDKVLIVSPKTWAASCIFGAGSGWCTKLEDTDFYFKKHTEGDDGILYYILTKKLSVDDQFWKIAVHVLPDESKTAWDFDGDKFDFEDIFTMGFDIPKDIFIPKEFSLDEFAEKYFDKNEVYTQHKDGSISYPGSITIKTQFKKLPVQFKKVGGDFEVEEIGLETLEGCPEEVGGSFNCGRNNIQNLRGGPTKVGKHYFCHDNVNLESLVGCPEEIPGGFDTSHSHIKNLKGGPTKVGETYYAEYCDLRTLEGAPKEVKISLYVSHNNINTLKGIPKDAKYGGLDLSSNTLKSLEGSPDRVNGNFDVSHNKLESLEGCPEYVTRYFICTQNMKKFEKDYILSVCHTPASGIKN